MITSTNSLYRGTPKAHNSRPEFQLSDRCRAAKQLAIQATLREASMFARDRRKFVLTGGHHQPIEAVIKGLAKGTNGYSHKLSKVPQADAVAEPSHDSFVDMLETLPSSEMLLQ